MRPLRIAVIGVGHLGRHHARILSGFDDVQVVGLADPSPQPRDEVAASYGIPAHADYAPLVDHVDAAVVAAPTDLHYDIAGDLLGRGIHLLVEKPLTPAVAESDALVALAERRGVVLQVGHVERFNPALAAVRTHVRDPKYIDAGRFCPLTLRSTDIGVVLDLMIHDIDLVLSMVTGPVRHVEAVGISLLGGHEDVATAWLNFESGCVATLSASRASYAAGRTMQIWSPRAYASVDFTTRKTTLVRPDERLLRRELDVTDLSAEGREHLKDHLFDDYFVRTEIEAEPADALTLELRDFVDSIRQNRAPRVTGAQARDAVEIAEAILDSIARHRWDRREDGAAGPLATPTPSVIPGPHWSRRAVDRTAGTKRAG